MGDTTTSPHCKGNSQYSPNYIAYFPNPFAVDEAAFHVPSKVYCRWRYSKFFLVGRQKMSPMQRVKLDFVPIRLTVRSMAMSRIICRIHTQFIQASAKVLLELKITVFRRHTHRFLSVMMPPTPTFRGYQESLFRWAHSRTNYSGMDIPPSKYVPSHLQSSPPDWAQLLELSNPLQPHHKFILQHEVPFASPLLGTASGLFWLHWISRTMPSSF